VLGATHCGPLQSYAELRAQLAVTFACLVEVHDRKSGPGAGLGVAGTL